MCLPTGRRHLRGRALHRAHILEGLRVALEFLDEIIKIIRASQSSDQARTEMMKRFVMAGLGLAFLANSNCVEEIGAGRLAALPLAPEPMARQLGLIYRRDKALSKAALGFINVTLAHADTRGAGNEPARERVSLREVVKK